MSKPRTILASDLCEGDCFRHIGVLVEVNAVRITQRSTFVIATPVEAPADEDDEGIEEVEVRFRRDARVRIFPKPRKAPAGKPPLSDSGISENPVPRFFVRNHRADAKRSHDGAR